MEEEYMPRKEEDPIVRFINTIVYESMRGQNPLEVPTSDSDTAPWWGPSSALIHGGSDEWECSPRVIWPVAKDKPVSLAPPGTREPGVRVVVASSKPSTGTTESECYARPGRAASEQATRRVSLPMKEKSKRCRKPKSVVRRQPTGCGSTRKYIKRLGCICHCIIHVEKTNPRVAYDPKNHDCYLRGNKPCPHFYGYRYGVREETTKGHHSAPAFSSWTGAVPSKSDLIGQEKLRASLMNKSIESMKKTGSMK
jgi:hypothetical protein